MTSRVIRFQSLVRLTGSTGWKSQLLFQWPFSSLKLLNWFDRDQMLLTGLVSFRFSSLAEASDSSGSAAGAAWATSSENSVNRVSSGLRTPSSFWAPSWVGRPAPGSSAAARVRSSCSSSELSVCAPAIEPTVSTVTTPATMTDVSRDFHDGPIPALLRGVERSGLLRPLLRHPCAAYRRSVN